MSRRPAIAATSGLLAGALGFGLALSQSPQLVSFVPVRGTSQLAQTLNPHDLAKAMGGTPQLVKASLPASPAPSATHAKPRGKLLKSPVLRTALKHAESRRSAAAPDLISTAAPMPSLESHTLVVMTAEWTYEVRPRALAAVSPADLMERRDGPAKAAQAPAAMPVRATYAIVPTPAGWLIIQI